MANEAQVTQKLSGRLNGWSSTVAAARAALAVAEVEVDQSRADLANAQWNLDQTVAYRSANGYAINVQLRPGSFTVPAMPLAPAMSFVEEEYQVIALYQPTTAAVRQARQPGGVHAPHVPGARHQGHRSTRSSGRRDRARWRSRASLPQTGVYPQVPGRFPVKFDVAERDRDLFLACRRGRRRRDLHRARARRSTSCAW